MSHADITAAPFTVHIDGKDYKAKPLTGDDLGEIEEHAKSMIMSVVYKAIEANPSMPHDVQSRMIDTALTKALDVSFTRETEDGKPSEIERLMSTIKGMQMILWISIREFHPDVLPGDLGSTSVMNMVQDQLAILMAKSGFGVTVEEGTADAPTKRRRRKSKASKAARTRKKPRKSKSR